MEHHQASNQKKIKQSQQDKNSQNSYSSEEINSMTRNKKLKIVYESLSSSSDNDREEEKKEEFRGYSEMIGSEEEIILRLKIF